MTFLSHNNKEIHITHTKNVPLSEFWLQQVGVTNILEVINIVWVKDIVLVLYNPAWEINKLCPSMQTKSDVCMFTRTSVHILRPAHAIIQYGVWQATWKGNTEFFALKMFIKLLNDLLGFWHWSLSKTKSPTQSLLIFWKKNPKRSNQNPPSLLSEYLLIWT